MARTLCLVGLVVAIGMACDDDDGGANDAAAALDMARTVDAAVTPDAADADPGGADPDVALDAAAPDAQALDAAVPDALAGDAAADAMLDAQAPDAEAPDPLATEYCRCMLAACHDAFHALWGESDEEALENCDAAADELAQAGAEAMAGDVLECRIHWCDQADLTGDEAANCPAALGEVTCVD